MSTDPPASGQPQGLTLAALAASAFLLRMLEFVSRDLDLVDTILLLAALQANVAQVSADRGLQVRYSALEALPPDDLRRPISVTALAASLGLPFETARRRLGNLEQAGLCEACERGYRIPSRVLLDSRFARGPQEIDSLLRILHGALAEAGVLDGLAAAPENSPPFTEPPVRISARLATDYFLRMLSLVAERAGDPIDGFLLLSVVDGNRIGFPPRPVKAATVGRKLRLPHETARRRLLSLEARGLCARSGGGWILPAASLEALRFEEALSENLANLRQLFTGLTRLGVIGHWGRAAA